jgi:hypothetical protein
MKLKKYIKKQKNLKINKKILYKSDFPLYTYLISKAQKKRPKLELKTFSLSIKTIE